MKSGKVPGVDRIAAEMLKVDAQSQLVTQGW